MVADLVAGVAHAAGDIRPRLGDPARDEERRPEPEPVEHPEQPRNGDLRAVALVRDDVEVVGGLGVVGQHRGLGVDVEAEERGGADAVGPAKTGRERVACGSMVMVEGYVARTRATNPRRAR